MSADSLIAIDTATLAWEERFNETLGRVILRKNLVTDPETGMEVRLVRYPAGVMNVRHTHPCAHGMYVLEGTLVTHAGSFGPGCFVWFPEGTVMEHGASADADVTVLFITNKDPLVGPLFVIAGIATQFAYAYYLEHKRQQGKVKLLTEPATIAVPVRVRGAANAYHRADRK